MIWSVRRELWENRSIWIAPLIVAGVIVLGALAGTLFATSRHGVKVSSQPNNIAAHYEMAAGALMVTMLIVSIFYCLDALYGERRDRSILFWKSMPVSDWTAVLSKMAVPLVIVPVVTFVITFVTQLIMLLLSSAVLSMNGRSTAALWALPWLQIWSGLLYHVVTVHGLYYAPLFGWLLLVSAWAKRLPFLWAFLPPAAVGFAEKMIFNTSHFGMMLGNRLSGGMDKPGAKGGLMILWPSNPLEFLTMPGLWIGFAIAAVFLAGAVYLRRARDPI
jgi:ABC-2 type transport system permease protein